MSQHELSGHRERLDFYVRMALQAHDAGFPAAARVYRRAHHYLRNYVIRNGGRL